MIIKDQNEKQWTPKANVDHEDSGDDDDDDDDQFINNSRD